MILFISSRTDILELWLSCTLSSFEVEIIITNLDLHI